MKYENDVTKYVGAQIKKYRKRKKMTQKELGFKIGVKHNTISGYESGTSEPEQNMLFAISDALEVSINDLFPSPTNMVPVSPQTVRIPVLGEIACGNPLLAEENIVKYRNESPDDLPSGKLAYLKAKGSSMEPTVPDGSLVLIREQEDVENGEIAAVLVNGNTEATLKRVRKQGGIIMLIPDNPAHETVVISEDNPARIIGKAVRFTQDL